MIVFPRPSTRNLQIASYIHSIPFHCWFLTSWSNTFCNWRKCSLKAPTLLGEDSDLARPRVAALPPQRQEDHLAPMAAQKLGRLTRIPKLEINKHLCVSTSTHAHSSLQPNLHPRHISRAKQNDEATEASAGVPGSASRLLVRSDGLCTFEFHSTTSLPPIELQRLSHPPQCTVMYQGVFIFASHDLRISCQDAIEPLCRHWMLNITSVDPTNFPSATRVVTLLWHRCWKMMYLH